MIFIVKLIDLHFLQSLRVKTTDFTLNTLLRRIRIGDRPSPILIRLIKKFIVDILVNKLVIRLPQDLINLLLLHCPILLVLLVILIITASFTAPLLSRQVADRSLLSWTILRRFFPNFPAPISSQLSDVLLQSAPISPSGFSTAQVSGILNEPM